MNKPPKYNREAAEAVAIQALGFLVEDGDRLQRFLALSGLAPADIEKAHAALTGGGEYLRSI
jgi:hypothetical protein